MDDIFASRVNDVGAGFGFGRRIPSFIRCIFNIHIIFCGCNSIGISQKNISEQNIIMRN